MTPSQITRLEKTAVDNGFDRELPRQDDWLAFASTQAPLRIWLTAIDDDWLVLAVSQANVARTLADQAAEFDATLPQGAQAAFIVPTASAFHHIVRRAFQLSRTLPDELLHVFEQQISGLPRATEAERLVVERVGQNVFRAGLLEYWEGRCAVTGLAVTALLRASHIKPWAACARRRAPRHLQRPAPRTQSRCRVRLWLHHGRRRWRCARVHGAWPRTCPSSRHYPRLAGGAMTMAIAPIALP